MQCIIFKQIYGAEIGLLDCMPPSAKLKYDQKYLKKGPKSWVWVSEVKKKLLYDF